jgi:hypothetical protein
VRRPRGGRGQQRSDGQVIRMACQACGATIAVFPSRWRQRYCSLVCAGVARRKAIVAPRTGRDRARRWYRALTACERCGVAATDRHHKDGDPSHDAPEDIALLCRRCHMEEDGRLGRFVRAGVPTRGTTKPPAPCSNCGVPAKPLRRGRCHRCADWWYRHATERPPVRGRLERSTGWTSSMA